MLLNPMILPGKKIELLAGVFLSFLIAAGGYAAEKVYVIERERGSVAVIEGNKLGREIEDLGNLNHATLKFEGGYAYLISRDGFLSKLDTRTDTLIKKVKAGNSGIGFTFCKGLIAVANYDPKEVAIFDSSLEVFERIETGSRNVGIKCWDNLLVFSLMDKDEIWVYKIESREIEGKNKISLFKAISPAGKMPFDALISEDIYITGFFNERGIGILKLKDMTYHKTLFKGREGEVVFKIPHFGSWGVLKDRAYVPAVGERKLHVIGIKNFSYLDSIELIGLPVFAVSSPDMKYIAVNYSGDKEDFVTVIDSQNNKPVKNIKVGGRVMHLRFSEETKTLYVSSYFQNTVKAFDVNTWTLVTEIPVPTPSGIFVLMKK